MNTQYWKKRPDLPLKAVSVAVALAFSAAAWSDEDEVVTRLIRPESTVGLTVGRVSDTSQRFGVYNGLNKEGNVGIGEFSLVRRDDETGTWFRAQGRNLGLSNAELRFEHERQGQWQYFLEVDQLTRTTPYEVRSRIQGAGTNNLNIPAAGVIGLLPDVKTERLGSKLGFSHIFSPELEVRMLFQNVNKKGTRLFGRGTNTGSVQEFLLEPIDSTTRQLDMVLNYTGDKLQLSGGYYGSWFRNANTQLNIAGGNAALSAAAGPNLPFTVISLPPDNFAHQLDLTGGYQFTEKTRGSFTLAYTRALQVDNFASVPAPTIAGLGLPAGGLNMSGRNDLGGRLDTTLINLGLTSRPIKDLFLLGNLRYENRQDMTAVAKYINVTATNSTTDGYNEPRSLKVSSGKFEASYHLPLGYRVTGGVEAEQKAHSTAGIRVVAYRDKIDEISYRVELKKAVAESLNGSIAYIHSDRTGSAYNTLQTYNAVTGVSPGTTAYSNRIQPIYVADRKRDKLRIFADWSPLDPLNFQFAFEDSRDNYGAGRDSLDIGVRSGSARLYSVDASWTVNDNWRANGWVSRNETRMRQADGNTAATYWTSDLKNNVDSIGLGLRGKITTAIDIGADALVSRDTSIYGLGGAATSLPDIKYEQTTLKFFGRYAVDRDTSVRLDYVLDYRKTNDWTWNGTPTSGAYQYTDGTTLTQRPDDKVHFIGVSVNYAFR